MIQIFKPRPNLKTWDKCKNLVSALTTLSSIENWSYLFINVVWVLIFIMYLFGFGNWIQVYWWKADIKSKLTVLNDLANSAKSRTAEYMKKNKAKDSSKVLDRLIDFFAIDPVNIEPTDIINRMRHIINIRESRFKKTIEESMPDSNERARSIASTATEIASALFFIYKYVRHLLLSGEKTKNWYLIMYLSMMMPQIMQIANIYRKALDDFLDGVPVGDGAGPIVALKMSNFNKDWRDVDEDTVATESEYNGRKLILVKAKGPASTVGRPGEATEKLIRESIANGERVSLLITVDAALKFEGEETGSIAEGAGAAIGDPGPEKIRFERIATQYNIPLRAVVIKMGMDEAIMGMNKKILDGIDKAVERVKRIIEEESKPGETVFIAGIGNTAGVGQ